MKKKKLFLSLILLIFSMMPMSGKKIRLNHNFSTSEGCVYHISGWVDVNILTNEINCYNINVSGLSTNPSNCPKVNLQLQSNC
jgi:hypothetical protein